MEYSFWELQAKILESFDYFEYLNSISFHPPAMIITTLIFFYIRRKILLVALALPTATPCDQSSYFDKVSPQDIS